MVTRASKPKKRRPAKKTETPPFELPELMPDVYPVEANESAKSMPEPTVESPPLSSVKTEPESPPDYGQSIGVLLGQASPEINIESDVDVPMGEEVGPTGSGERLPIEKALRLARGEESEPEVEEEMAGPGPVRSLTGQKMILAGLFVLTLIFSAAAVAGIIMFVRKNGVPSIAELSERISLFKEPAPAPVVEPERAKTVLTVVLVSKEPAAAGDMANIVSRVIETDVNASQTFDASGSAPAAAAKATGTIVVNNTTTRPYTFVATTRFLSKSGVLFRLNKTTLIPAQAKTRIAVTADKAGPEGDIAPTTFTVPGLPTNVQDEVSGESDAAMSGGSGTVKVVSAADLAKAKAALLATLEVEAGKNLEAMLLDGEKVHPDLVSSEELSVEAPTEGTKTASFTMKLSMRFRVLVLPDMKVRLALAEKLKATDATANEADLGPARYVVQAYDVTGQRAEVRAEADVSQE